MSGDAMSFPGDWRTFVQQYQFADKEEVYTNGSMLIPTFRVRQMVEHYFGGGECELEIKDNMNETEGTGAVWWECSSCHWQIEFFHTKWLKNAKFCPQCGTRIREMKR